MISALLAHTVVLQQPLFVNLVLTVWRDTLTVQAVFQVTVRRIVKKYSFCVSSVSSVTYHETIVFQSTNVSV